MTNISIYDIDDPHQMVGGESNKTKKRVNKHEAKILQLFATKSYKT